MGVVLPNRAACAGPVVGAVLSRDAGGVVAVGSSACRPGAISSVGDVDRSDVARAKGATLLGVARDGDLIMSGVRDPLAAVRPCVEVRTATGVIIDRSPSSKEVGALALVGATLEIILAIGLLNFEVVVRILQLRRNNIARQG